MSGEIKHCEVPYFRGAVIAVLNGTENMLLHNHVGDDGYRYSYPKIQYKILDGRAALVCIEDGIDTVAPNIMSLIRSYQIGNRELAMTIQGIEPEEIDMDMCEPIKYKVTRWLPLNTENYTAYKSTESLRERIILLERILKGNILSMAKGIDMHIDHDVTVDITELSQPYTTWHKQMKLMAFDISFTTNIALPNHIGLGKNASLGCGVVERIGTPKITKTVEENKKAVENGESKSKERQSIFMLGGQDLEMKTIKNILINHGCIVYDEALAWDNALLSRYKAVIEDHPGCEFYGIELQSDIEEPEHYTLIDHHNDHRKEPASIEQIADLLGCKLSRFHMLVAANDKGYIPGMEAIDATKEEIWHIRQLDRIAQGVTEEEEITAEAEVEHAIDYGRLKVVKTTLKHFSPIVDRMYPYDRLLICSDSELTYYGAGIDKLRDKLKPFCKDLYCGGCGNDGYLGIPKSTPDVFEKIKQKIIELTRC